MYIAPTILHNEWSYENYVATLCKQIITCDEDCNNGQDFTNF